MASRGGSGKTWADPYDPPPPGGGVAAGDGGGGHGPGVGACLPLRLANASHLPLPGEDRACVENAFFTVFRA